MTQKHIESLKEQLNKVKKDASLIHAECYRILNEPHSYNIFLYNEYQQYQEEEVAIRKLFKSDDGDIAELFDNYMNEIYAKQNARKKQLDSLRHQMNLLGIGDDSGDKSFKFIVGDVKSTLQQLKESFQNFTNETLSQIRKSRRAVKLLINYRKEEADKKIQSLEDYEKKIVEKFENAKQKQEQQYNDKLAARRIRVREIYHENYLQEDRDIVTVSKIYQQLVPFKERLVKFTAKFDILFRQLDSMDTEINKLERQVTELKTQKEQMKEIRASQLYNKFTQMLIKGTRQEEALDEALRKIEERKAKLMPNLEKERVIATMIVPGTTKTVREIRAEIKNLMHQVGSETLSKSQYIRSLTEAEREFSKTADALIEELEDEVKSKNIPPKQ